VITADGSLRRGRTLPMKETLDEAVALSPSVEHVIVWPRLGLEDVPMTPGRDHFWADVVAGTPGTTEPLAVDSEHPYLLAYTSGTTGRPKGVVHVQGGFPIPIAAHNYYLLDLQPDDRMLFVTDMGWIMGPWTVMGAGFCGATIVFLEGAPDWPHDRLWKAVESEKVTVLGIPPTVARALMPHGDPQADLTSLRAFMTTGEPWNLDPYMWLFDVVGGGRCPIINASGGTEAGVLLSCAIVEPIAPCSLGLPYLGHAMEVFDEEGRPVRGGLGELVCLNASPSFTRGLWRDDERYLETYWSRFPGVYGHGDWASIDENGYWFLHGRSDDTMNIGGKRIGPAEIESSAVAHPAVAEAAAVALPHALKGESAWLFCCLTPGTEPSDELEREVLDYVAEGVGKAFRPEHVVFVPVLPKTRSQKVVRRAIRAAALGEDPGDMSAVENPDAVGTIAVAMSPFDLGS
jgi:acetyl-CoA synthetase